MARQPWELLSARPWQIRAQWHQTTVRALGVQDVTTHAPLRSRRTKAQTVSHVREPRAGESPTSLIIKIQGCWASAPLGCWAVISLPLDMAPASNQSLQ